MLVHILITENRFYIFNICHNDIVRNKGTILAKMSSCNLYKKELPLKYYAMMLLMQNKSTCISETLLDSIFKAFNFCENFKQR